MLKRPTINHFNVISLAPTNKAYAHLFPKYSAYTASFEISNVLSSVPSAIRRTICNELPIKGLNCGLNDITTTDVFHIHEMILSRLRMIPVQQSVKIGTTYNLKATNDTHELITVYSKELRSADRIVAFNENIPLFTLAAGTSITIQCKVVENYGYVREYGAFTAGINVVSMPNGNNWLVKFTNNGTATAKHIVTSAVKNIIARLSGIDLEFISEGGIHVLTIPHETKTIGHLIQQHVLQLYPNCNYIICHRTQEGSITLRVQCDDPMEIFTTTIKHLVDIYRQLNV